MQAWHQRFLRGFCGQTFRCAPSYGRILARRAGKHDSKVCLDGAAFSALAVQHVIRCIGTVCEYLRYGRDDMVQRAITKLDRLAEGFLHSRDSYSSVLAKLVGAVSRRYVETSLWGPVAEMQVAASPDTIEALTQFARAQFANKRALVWPAQAAGISRLRGGGSFALCTPTGSGKTTVATLGIIPALFENNPNAAEGLDGQRTGNLVLYLVPSRALAAEVEERLAEDLRGISAQRIVVTGLYGGTDWGPHRRLDIPRSANDTHLYIRKGGRVAAVSWCVVFRPREAGDY